MRLFVLHTTETLKRAHRVAAPDAASARRALSARLAPGQKLVGNAEPLDHAADLASGEGALARLLSSPYLDCGGDQLRVEDWVLTARTGAEDRAEVNPLLAPIGLRVTEDDRLLVASANSIPGLALLFEGTCWAGPGLMRALSALPGAVRPAVSRTFAGRGCRVVSLPLSTVFAVQPEAPTRQVTA